MGKGAGTVLGIIGILLGAGGLTLGLISWFSLEEAYTQRSWYDYVDLDGLSTTTRENIYGLSITMNLKSDEILYVSFTCTVQLDGLWAEFYVYIDNSVTSGRTAVSRDGIAGYLRYTAAIQHINNTLTGGDHTITVRAYTDDPGTLARDCVLFVQTLKS